MTRAVLSICCNVSCTECRSLDQLIGARQQAWRNGQAQRFGGLEIDHQLEPRLLTATGFSNVHVDMDTHSFRYANADDYWGQARGTGLRRILDSLDSAQTERVRSALVERMRQLSGQTASMWRQRRSWQWRTVDWQCASSVAGRPTLKSPAQCTF